LNQAVLFTTLQTFTCFHSLAYVSDMSIGEFRLAYETCRTRILFFERYARTLTYSILA